MTLWFDVTTVVAWSPPMTGIPRTEMRLAESLCARDAAVRLCVYEVALRRFSEVRREDFRRHRDDRRPAGAQPERVELAVQRLDRRDVGGAEIFAPGDVLVSCGFHWNPRFGDMPRLYALAASIGFSVVPLCHDLIPLRSPHFVPGFAKIYKPYIDDLLRHATHVLCNSRDTRRELLRYAGEQGLRLPPTSLVALGTDFAEADAGSAPPSDAVRALLDKPFLLAVGTLEVRKNQETLCRAYMRLVDWGAQDLPVLVLVGRVGIGIGGPELMRMIAAETRIRDRVVVLEAATDADLALLYRHCLFLLCPSLAEGWGLPLGEALARGKFALVSDRAALPEVGGDLVDYLDPWNVDAWAERIFRYLHLPRSLARREEEIRRDYRAPTWDAAAAAVLESVGQLSAAS